ncbi:protein-L-isoaspartate(D-aspartate) O-methyltransferase [Streptomyces zhaozhouensis]|uniref:Protein-L-isoaspartate O-methyltransferase n=1 Tax=Streptomyces zhaozhouensis TaxID=1300267 RepID=A0A286DKR4_9ACTN|nr:methyltransferase domain-containing protein [Streptomyces zhaozhouensis]SOD59173.1 protein-L-isoaspartate(D-aspartate) O-methyltransferase [Streptomyces zhaozhouensis]
MTATPAEESAVARLLAHVADFLGRPVPGEWARALRAVPRHLFLPDLVWLRDGRGGHAPCDRAREPARWWEAAYADVPVVTRLTREPGGATVPTSSASAPGTVVAMLEALDLRAGDRVLEIGTGTGWNAALLAVLAGDSGVVTVEVDAEVADRARAALAGAGRTPRVVTGDGAAGWPAGAPYQRVVATCSVRAVPPAWLDQLAAPGRLVAPWDAAWCSYGTLVVETDARGAATGRWQPGGSYMPLRPADDGVVDPGAGTATGTDAGGSPAAGAVAETERARPEPTPLSPWAVAGADYEAQFVVGLLVPGVWHAWETGERRAGVHARLWVRAEDGASTALVEVAAAGGRTTVRHRGPRRLWDEITAAWHWWHAAGRPDMTRFGYSREPGGRPLLWLDTPERPLPAGSVRP